MRLARRCRQRVLTWIRTKSRRYSPAISARSRSSTAIRENPEGAVDVIIPIIHTNELWRANLKSIYREIPVNRLILGDGGCIDDSIDVAREFPRVQVLDHTKFTIARLQHPPSDRSGRNRMVRLSALRRVPSGRLVRGHVRASEQVRLVRVQSAHQGDGGLSVRHLEDRALLFRQPDGPDGGDDARSSPRSTTTISIATKTSSCRSF